jgi:hypothetical protein
MELKKSMRQIKILIAAWAVCFAAVLNAQSPPPKLGYLRFWDMLPSTSGAFELCKADGGDASPGLLNGTSYRYSSYGEFPVGRYHLAVFKKGDRKAPIKIFDINLLQDTFFTVLLVPRAGVADIEVIEDTNDPKADSATLVVRNYFTGLTVSISSDAQKLVNALQYGQSNVVTGLPLKRVPLTLVTRLPNGMPAESTAEADFMGTKRATLLIIPDSYGRFRPRVALDGKN